MARERFSFDDTIEFDKDELKPNNDIHANHTGKFTFDDEVKEKKVAKPKKKKRKLKTCCFNFICCCSSCFFPLYFCFFRK